MCMDKVPRKRPRDKLIQPKIDKFTFKLNSKVQKTTTTKHKSNLAGDPLNMMSFAKPQPAKLVIKSFKNKPRLPDNYEEVAWDRLKKAVHAIYESRPVADSLEGLYRVSVFFVHVHDSAVKMFVITKWQKSCTLDYLKSVNSM